MDAPTDNPVWQTANDVQCKTADEFLHWILLFNKAGKPEQALILEAQLEALKKKGPRVRCRASSRHQFIGDYKGHSVEVWRHDTHRPWHFVVTCPDGTRAADGQMKRPGTMREAIVHAVCGALLYP